MNEAPIDKSIVDNSLLFLLSDPSPILRYLTLTQLCQRSDDDEEVRELRTLRSRDRLLQFLSAGTESNHQRNQLINELHLLGYLGYDSSSELVQSRAQALFSRQNKNGSWPMPRTPDETKGYTMIPLQTAIPLIAVATCGYAEDPRAERAYDWLLDKRLPDGAWPTGINSGVFGGVAGYRRLAHSRWGCRSNTTGAVKALSRHPVRRTTAEARRGLDHLLGCESEDRTNVGHEVARIVGAEETQGFLTYFGRIDPALVLDLCWRIGADTNDTRVAELVQFIFGLRQPGGGFPYVPKPQASRWVSFDLIRSLSRIREDIDWIPSDPSTPFQKYPKPPRRW
jgi:hypothetical protein